MFIFPSVIPLPKVVQNLYCEFKELRYFSLVTCSAERDFQKCAFKFALRIYRWKMNVVLKKRFKRLPFTYEVLRLAAGFWHLGRCFSSFESQLFHCCLACIYRFDQPRILKFSATLTFALVLHQKVPSSIFFFLCYCLFCCTRSVYDILKYNGSHRASFFYLRFISLTSEVTNTVRPVVLPVVHQLLFNSSSDPWYQTSLFFQIRGLDIYCVLCTVLTIPGLRILNYCMYCRGFFCRRKNRKSMLPVLLIFCMFEPKFFPIAQLNSCSCLFALRNL